MTKLKVLALALFSLTSIKSIEIHANEDRSGANFLSEDSHLFQEMSSLSDAAFEQALTFKEGDLAYKTEVGQCPKGTAYAPLEHQSYKFEGSNNFEVVTTFRCKVGNRHFQVDTKTGQIVSTWTMHGPWRDGYTHSYYPSGAPRNLAIYKNGNLSYPFIEWSESGETIRYITPSQNPKKLTVVKKDPKGDRFLIYEWSR
jgi:antitoxin component YwqK of YwqJK toxin-antitoxin module